MKCPVCSTPLAGRRIGGEAAYMCRSGHGLAIPQEDLRDALRALAKEAAAPSAHDGCRVDNERSCPACNTPMDKYPYGYNSGIKIDSCGACGLLWLDKGEIEQLATYLRESSHSDRLTRAVALMVDELRHMGEFELGITRWVFFFARGPLGYAVYFLSQTLLRYTNRHARLAAELALIFLLAALLLAGMLLDSYHEELNGAE